jgi:hypothetical protein
MSGWRCRLEVWRRLVFNDSYLHRRVLAAGIRKLLMDGQWSLSVVSRLRVLTLELQSSEKGSLRTRPNS